MANAVFIAKKSSRYDDAPELRYHFPSRYLARVRETVGDWILYYESRRDGGKMVYFAAARVARIEHDPVVDKHYYAYVSDYIDFTEPVSFSHNGKILEVSLLNPDGKVNQGRGINAVRLISTGEFQTIFRLGMTSAIPGDSAKGNTDTVDEAVIPNMAARDVNLVSRAVREVAFSRNVKHAYRNTCAFTGLRIIDDAGRPEVEAAHIRGVSFLGPDAVRNGIALSRTLHWMFDKGIFSIDDDGRILSANKLIPDRVNKLLNPSGYITFPLDEVTTPHHSFLRFHRENVFIG